MRTAITGIGLVTPLGVGTEDSWESLVDGLSAADEPQGAHLAGLPPLDVGEVLDYDFKQYLRSKKHYLDRNSKLAFGAAALALREVGLEESPPAPERFGLAVGTAFGNSATVAAFYARVLEKGPRLAPPLIFPHAYPSATDSLLSIEFEARGPNCNFCSGSVSGAQAIAYAADQIACGKADVMLAGGVDALSREIVLGLLAEGLAGEDGFVPAEAAVFLVLESEDHAQKRGAPVFAVCTGAGMGGTGGTTQGCVCRAAETAVNAALAEAGARPESVQAAFTAARMGHRADAEELNAIRTILPQSVPLVAPQAFTGVVFGASGPLTAATAALAVRNAKLPPPLQDSPAGPEAGEEPVSIELARAVVEATGTTGNSVALVIEKP